MQGDVENIWGKPKHLPYSSSAPNAQAGRFGNNYTEESDGDFPPLSFISYNLSCHIEVRALNLQSEDPCASPSSAMNCVTSSRSFHKNIICQA